MTAATAAHSRVPDNPNRQENDFYTTPPHCTRALLDAEGFPGPIWEPACGNGAMSKVLIEYGYDVISTDLIDRGYGIGGMDFLRFKSQAARSVITNPPFKIADEFVLHAIECGYEKIAIFQRSSWTEGRARYEALWKPYPPIRIWQFSGRQTLWRADDPNPRSTGGAIAFSWYIWERGFQGAPSYGWLP